MELHSCDNFIDLHYFTPFPLSIINGNSLITVVTVLMLYPCIAMISIHFMNLERKFLTIELFVSPC